MPSLAEAIDALRLFVNHPAVQQLLEKPVVLALYQGQKSATVSAVATENLRESLRFILNEEHYAQKLQDSVHQFLLALAEFNTLNKKDPVSRKMIDKNEAVFVSTGHQFHFESFLSILDEPSTKNPFTNEFFCARDENYIRRQCYDKSVKKLEVYVDDAKNESWLGFFIIATVYVLAHSCVDFESNAETKSHAGVQLVNATFLIMMYGFGHYFLRNSDIPYSRAFRYQQTVNKFKNILNRASTISENRRYGLIKTLKTCITALSTLSEIPSIDGLLKSRSMRRVYECQEVDEIDDNDIIELRNQALCISKGISKLVIAIQSFGLVEEVLHQFLLALAEFDPINPNDPITLEKVEPADAVYVSTGHQFDIYQVGRLERNAYTGCAFSTKDQQHIKNTIKSKIVKPCVKMEWVKKLIPEEFLILCSMLFVYCYIRIINGILCEKNSVYDDLMLLNLSICALSGSVIILSCFQYAKSCWEEWRCSRHKASDSESQLHMGKFNPASRPGFFSHYWVGECEASKCELAANTSLKMLS